MVLLKSHVILLKTQNEQSVDKYESLLKSNKIEVTLIKTLVFDYQNLEVLAEKLNRSEEYSGIIFSSPRCVQAVNLARRKTDSDISLWVSKSNFSVGEATALEAFKCLNLKCSGQDSGTAINLVKYIIKDKSKYEKPFLFPHGSLKTDTISRELEQEGMLLDSVLVYDTKPNPSIEDELKAATNNFHDIPEFVVFFSPSGLRSSLKFLKNIKDFSDAKIIAIGPTTESAIKQEDLPVFGVAKQPTPQDILNLLLV